MGARSVSKVLVATPSDVKKYVNTRGPPLTVILFFLKDDSNTRLGLGCSPSERNHPMQHLQVQTLIGSPMKFTDIKFLGWGFAAHLVKKIIL